MSFMFNPELPTDTREYELGTMGTNDGKQFVYCRATETIPHGNFCYLSGNYNARRGGSGTGRRRAGARGGVSPFVSIANREYFWLQVYGQSLCSTVGASSTGSRPNRQLSLTTVVGSLIELSTGGGRIHGIQLIDTVPDGNTVFARIALYNPSIRE